MTQEMQESRLIADIAHRCGTDLNTARQAIEYADSVDRRGCAYWNGMVEGFIAGCKKSFDIHSLYNAPKYE